MYFTHVVDVLVSHLVGEFVLEMAQLLPLTGKGNRLSPEELGLLAKELAAATDPIEAARIKDRLTRGFFGVRRKRVA